MILIMVILCCKISCHTIYFMDSVPLNIMVSSREFDNPLGTVATSELPRQFENIFELDTRAALLETSVQSLENCYSAYICKAPIPHFFAGCDTLKVFLLAINLYLSQCTNEELALLLTKKNFFRVNMYYNDTQEKSYIAVLCNPRRTYRFFEGIQLIVLWIERRKIQKYVRIMS